MKNYVAIVGLSAETASNFCKLQAAEEAQRWMGVD